MSIEAIDLNKCNLYKDFGQAFCLTEDRDAVSDAGDQDWTYGVTRVLPVEIYLGGWL